MKSLRRVSFPTSPLSFIKLILSNTRSSRIEIPKRFTANHGDKLLDRVILKVPNGDIWQIDLLKSKGSIWLNNGWREFAEHYNLKHGNVLMFDYEGFSILSVFIFDSSACQIVYPQNRNRLAHNSTEIMAVRGSDPCEKLNDDELKTVKSEETWDQDEETEIKKNGERSIKGRYGNKRKRAFEAAKASFKSDKPFFMVYMIPSRIFGRTSLPIPVKFIRKNWSGYKKHKTCLLRLAKSNATDDGKSKTWEMAAFDSGLGIRGWKVFVKDNGICAGDVCVFELINKHRNLLDVSIFKSS